MSREINRDPEAILSYTTGLNESIENVESIMSKASDTVNGCADKLDSSVNNLINEFNQSCRVISDQFAKYSRVSAALERSSRALMEIDSETSF